MGQNLAVAAAEIIPEPPIETGHQKFPAGDVDAAWMVHEVDGRPVELIIKDRGCERLVLKIGAASDPRARPRERPWPEGR